MLDVTNLADEIDAMGKSQRRELQSRLLQLLLHMLKVRHQPERDGSSWRGSIAVQRAEIRKLPVQNPSLRRCLPDDLGDAYADARDAAAAETGLAIGTFPAACPWPIDEVLPARRE
ncbi:MAG: DUF29 domain-containing protein [Alphaproteobacteria bacterium]|nr:DUF29 domain-containing protein [Alphaproteobacteria bacterium]